MSILDKASGGKCLYVEPERLSNIKRIAIISGGAASYVEEAAKKVAMPS
jgi:putative NIF3 family GTP cyclohydrolase 1 type 2